jgi:ligand-binding SRPBCC domain-containing protein
MSAIHTFEATQFVPATLDQVWDFISSPRNLKTITPPFMGFDIVNKLNSETMYPGIIIAYKVSPVLGIKMNWVTEITHVEDKHYFVDEQKIGPYSFWHHKHFIREVEGGVEMYDLLHYRAPFGIFGRLANRWIIRGKIEEIFAYRYKKVEEIFGTKQ